MKTRIIEPKDAHDLVIETAKRCELLIGDALAGVSIGQRFQIIGRIISLLFSRHFHMAVKFANESIEKFIEELPKEERRNEENI